MMRRQREHEEQQALLVKKDVPDFAGKGSPDDADDHYLSTDEQLEHRDYVQTLGNSANSPRPSN